jgi:hypothetical protein
MAAEREFTPQDLSRALSRSFAWHALGRVAEALAIGWLAAAVVLAAVALASTGARAEHVWLAAGIAGAAAAASTWIERAPAAREHVRSVDRRLGWNGALVTAADVSGDAGGGRLAGALVRHVGNRLDRARLFRASLPATPLALVAVILGAAIWLGARDIASQGAERAEPRTTAALDATQRAALAEAARALQAQKDRPGSDAVAGGREAILQAAAALDSAAEGRSLAPAQREALMQSLREALAAGRTTAADRDTLSRALAALDGAAAPTNPAPDADGAGGGLASGDSSGKMSGPDRRTDGSHSGIHPGSAPDAAERGVGSLRWWPARHDAVVEAWIGTRTGPQ